MNPRTRRAALHGIAVIAILANINALAHSYAGLYQWAIHHRITGWQALTSPAEIDIFLIIGELALYIAYLDAWPTRHKLWPWTTALVGLTISVTGNIGHILAEPGAQVPVVDRLTAATSALAAFAGLAIALLVLKQTRSSPARLASRGHWTRRRCAAPDTRPGVFRIPAAAPTIPVQLRTSVYRSAACARPFAPFPGIAGSQGDGPPRTVRDVRDLRAEYEQRGIHLSRRQLAAHLRARGHTLSNARIPEIADAIGLS